MVIKIDIENGYYLFKLDEILRNNNISINKLMRDTNTDYKVLKRLLKGDSIRIDIGVLARLCDYLDCSLNEIIQYHPNIYNKDKLN